MKDEGWDKIRLLLDGLLQGKARDGDGMGHGDPFVVSTYGRYHLLSIVKQIKS